MSSHESHHWKQNFYSWALNSSLRGTGWLTFELVNGVCNLGVVFDSTLSLTHYVKGFCKLSYIYIRDICRMRCFCDLTTRPRLSKVVFICLQNRGMDRMRSFCCRLLGSIFQNEMLSANRAEASMLHWDKREQPFHLVLHQCHVLKDIYGRCIGL